MAATNTTPGGTELASLMTPIAEEAKKLIEQEFNVLRRELKDELSKGRIAAFNLGTGAAMGGLSGILLSLMLVHLLERTTGIPLWLSYAIVGGILGAGSMTLVSAGAEQAADINLIR